MTSPHPSGKVSKMSHLTVSYNCFARTNMHKIWQVKLEILSYKTCIIIDFSRLNLWQLDNGGCAVLLNKYVDLQFNARWAHASAVHLSNNDHQL